MVRRGRRARNSGPERLDSADAEAGTNGDFRVVIITHDEDLIGLKSVIAQDVLEDRMFPPLAGLVDCVDVDGREASGDTQRPDFALLQTAKAGRDKESQNREFIENVEIAVALHGRSDLQMDQDLPPGGLHRRSETVFLGDEIERKSPRVSEGVREDCRTVRALVCVSDRVESGAKELLTGFISGAETTIQIEDDGFGHEPTLKTRKYW